MDPRLRCGRDAPAVWMRVGLRGSLVWSSREHPRFDRCNFSISIIHVFVSVRFTRRASPVAAAGTSSTPWTWPGIAGAVISSTRSVGKKNVVTRSKTAAWRTGKSLLLFPRISAVARKASRRAMSKEISLHLGAHVPPTSLPGVWSCPGHDLHLTGQARRAIPRAATAFLSRMVDCDNDSRVCHSSSSFSIKPPDSTQACFVNLES